ncbi:hypothetical protein [Sporosarcina ureae]|uniref:hypothetical protein n=1 Tax=Sporosarcina ureae TaxID=1571 RepID=UPI0026EE6E3C|nr:hypothetical protein [Sporosarcina ureae]
MYKKSTNKITGNDNKEFLRSLKNAKDEADVEQAYKRIFQKKYIDGTQGAIMNRPFGSDGYLRSGGFVLVLRMLMEFKKGTTLTQITTRARIIAQVVYYLKKFEQNGEELPNVIFSGDEQEMFVVYAPVLYHYLNEDYDWNIAPSDAPNHNIDLLRKLNEDPNLSSFVFDIAAPQFNINEVLEAIDSLVNNDGEMFKIRVAEANIRIVFDEFIRMIFSDSRKIKIGLDPAKEPHLLVSIFIQSILGDKHLYPVPKMKNTLHLPNGRLVKLDTVAFSSFFSRYERKYTIAEQDRLRAIADRLIEETTRRFSGDFWTPTIWSNRANEIISEIIGDNWRQDFTVWDPAAGAKNLTRDYQFSNLYSSTLHQEELDIGSNYNKGSISFQYDFLNDDVEINPDTDPNKVKMSKQLFEDLKNDKPIIFFANPPYATANDAGASGTSKENIAQTEINKIMLNDKMGAASQQLYAQFFYRILKLKDDFNLSNVYIAFFSKTQFLAGGSYWEGFNQKLHSQFEYKKGMLFNAGEFSDVRNIWAVTFSVYKQRDKVEKDYNELFEFTVEESTESGIVHKENKSIQLVSNDEFLSKWLREPNQGRRDYKEMPYPQFSSVFNVNENKGFRGRLLSNSIGYFVSVANNIYKSQRDVFILSGSAYMANGVSITPENFERVIVTFAARKSVQHSWLNDMDNFKSPNLEDIDIDVWSEFVNDCLIYSLFNINASYQSSLSNVRYHDDLYDIENEWFFMSYKDILVLSQQNLANSTEEQLRFIKEERFVYNKIQNTDFSEQAREVYDQAVYLLKESFKYRFIANQEHPEWNVEQWDAGFYQIYKIVDKYDIDGLDEFRNKFTNLELKIEKKVYDFGMLSK